MGKKESDDIEITPELILNAYCRGIFPMADSRNGEIYWYSPDPRGVFPLDTYKPKTSLRNILNRNEFKPGFNTAFLEVIEKCADRDETWISDDIISLYHQLYMMGYAHSVETWKNGELVGGLYGVSIGGAFFGESMFSTLSNSSKVALHFLVERLKNQGFVLLDTQFVTHHLEMLGAIEIARDDYLKRLRVAIQLPVRFI